MLLIKIGMCLARPELTLQTMMMVILIMVPRMPHQEVGSAIEDAAGSQAGKSAADDSDDLAEGDPVKTSAAFALNILASFEDGKETLWQ